MSSKENRKRETQKPPPHPKVKWYRTHHPRTKTQAQSKEGSTNSRELVDSLINEGEDLKHLLGVWDMGRRTLTSSIVDENHNQSPNPQNEEIIQFSKSRYLKTTASKPETKSKLERCRELARMTPGSRNPHKKARRFNRMNLTGYQNYKQKYAKEEDEVLELKARSTINEKKVVHRKKKKKKMKKYKKLDKLDRKSILRPIKRYKPFEDPGELFGRNYSSKGLQGFPMRRLGYNHTVLLPSKPSFDSSSLTELEFEDLKREETGKLVKGFVSRIERPEKSHKKVIEATRPDLPNKAKIKERAADKLERMIMIKIGEIMKVSKPRKPAKYHKKRMKHMKKIGKRVNKRCLRNTSNSLKESPVMVSGSPLPHRDVREVSAGLNSRIPELAKMEVSGLKSTLQQTKLVAAGDWATKNAFYYPYLEKYYRHKAMKIPNSRSLKMSKIDKNTVVMAKLQKLSGAERSPEARKGLLHTENGGLGSGAPVKVDHGLGATEQLKTGKLRSLAYNKTAKRLKNWSTLNNLKKGQVSIFDPIGDSEQPRSSSLRVLNRAGSGKGPKFMFKLTAKNEGIFSDLAKAAGLRHFQDRPRDHSSSQKRNKSNLVLLKTQNALKVPKKYLKAGMHRRLSRSNKSQAGSFSNTLFSSQNEGLRNFEVRNHGFLGKQLKVAINIK